MKKIEIVIFFEGYHFKTKIKEGILVIHNIAGISLFNIAKKLSISIEDLIEEIQKSVYEYLEELETVLWEKIKYH
jgi:hypothetical protein